MPLQLPGKKIQGSLDTSLCNDFKLLFCFVFLNLFLSKPSRNQTSQPGQRIASFDMQESSDLEVQKLQLRDLTPWTDWRYEVGKITSGSNEGTIYTLNL